MTGICRCDRVFIRRAESFGLAEGTREKRERARYTINSLKSFIDLLILSVCLLFYLLYSLAASPLFLFVLKLFILYSFLYANRLEKLNFWLCLWNLKVGGGFLYVSDTYIVYSSELVFETVEDNCKFIIWPAFYSGLSRGAFVVCRLVVVKNVSNIATHFVLFTRCKSTIEFLNVNLHWSSCCFCPFLSFGSGVSRVLKSVAEMRQSRSPDGAMFYLK